MNVEEEIDESLKEIQRQGFILITGIDDLGEQIEHLRKMLAEKKKRENQA